MVEDMPAKRTRGGLKSADSSEPHPTSDREPDDGRLAAAEVAAERMAAATRRVAGRAVDAAGAVVEAADGGRGVDPPRRRSTWRPQRAMPRSRARGTFPARRGVGLCRCPTCSRSTRRRGTRPLRELGLVSIPVDEIVGTAVMGAAQRGLDFQPLPPFRSKNWEARWQRIRRATQEMRSLPPIDVLRTHDGYWVTDGHNRVAAAKVVGQVELDADVKGVVLPGQPLMRPSGSLAPVLAESSQIEAAARGQLSRGTTLGRTVQERDLRPPPGDTDDAAPAAGHDRDPEAGR